jgi:hypothetical protein
MEPAHYTEPLEEALSQASQRIAQFASLTGAMAQVIWQRRALHDARQAARDDERATRIINEQERLIHRNSRLSWAPAHDPQWLARADLLQAGRAWAGAASYADTDPAAASAMRKCEDRLRTLHPYAMARYDRLRGDGISPLDAMRETVPLFGRSPHARTGDPAPFRHALGAGVSAGPDAPQPASGTPTDPAEPSPADDSDDRAEQRGRQIIERLQASARTTGRPELGPDELVMVLEAVTNLPEDMIERLIQNAPGANRPRSEDLRAVAAEDAPAANLDATVGRAATAVAGAHPASATAARSAAQLAAESFPRTAAEAIRTASAPGPGNSGRTPVRVHRPGREKPPGPSM